MNIDKFKEPERFKGSKGDPTPRGAGDRNRGFHEPKQTVEKIFQDPEENLRQPNYPDVPFNINESGERGGNHY